MKVKINIINKSNNLLPSYEHEGDAGMDIRANITEEWDKYLNITTDSIISNQKDFIKREGCWIYPLEVIMIPTGIFVAIPKGYEIQVRSRSGLAFKFGLVVLNSPGTIDSTYRGEIKIILRNTGSKPLFIEHGIKIAQLVLKQQPICEWKLVNDLDKTKRSDGGFGHTGNK